MPIKSRNRGRIPSIAQHRRAVSGVAAGNQICPRAVQSRDAAQRRLVAAVGRLLANQRSVFGVPLPDDFIGASGKEIIGAEGHSVNLALVAAQNLVQ